MITLLSLAIWSAPALAADEPSGIVPLPEGTVITQPGLKPFTTKRYAVLLPEDYYREAVAQGRRLEIIEPAFDQCMIVSEKWSKTAKDALDACSGQFDSDAKLIEDLRKAAATQEHRAATAEGKLADARSQRNVAWAIAGGLVLGAVAVTAVAIGN